MPNVRERSGHGVKVFGKMDYTLEEHEAIDSIISKNAGPSLINQKVGIGGHKLAFIEGWRLINLANKIFGFNGWSSSVVEQTIDFVDSYNSRYYVGVSAKVRLQLKDGTYHEDIGYGISEGLKSKGLSLEKAKKDSIADGLRRALKYFGNVFGNCLSNKEYLNYISKNFTTEKQKFSQHDIFNELPANVPILPKRALSISQKNKLPYRHTDSVEQRGLSPSNGRSDLELKIPTPPPSLVYQDDSFNLLHSVRNKKTNYESNKVLTGSIGSKSLNSPSHSSNCLSPISNIDVNLKEQTDCISTSSDEVASHKETMTNRRFSSSSSCKSDLDLNSFTMTKWSEGLAEKDSASVVSENDEKNPHITRKRPCEEDSTDENLYCSRNKLNKMSPCKVDQNDITEAGKDLESESSIESVLKIDGCRNEENCELSNDDFPYFNENSNDSVHSRSSSPNAFIGFGFTQSSSFGENKCSDSKNDAGIGHPANNDIEKSSDGEVLNAETLPAVPDPFAENLLKENYEPQELCDTETLPGEKIKNNVNTVVNTHNRDTQTEPDISSKNDQNTQTITEELEIYNSDCNSETESLYGEDDSAILNLLMEQELREAQKEETETHNFAKCLDLIPSKTNEKFVNEHSTIVAPVTNMKPGKPFHLSPVSNFKPFTKIFSFPKEEFSLMCTERNNDKSSTTTVDSHKDEYAVRRSSLPDGTLSNIFTHLSNEALLRVDEEDIEKLSPKKSKFKSPGVKMPTFTDKTLNRYQKRSSILNSESHNTRLNALLRKRKRPVDSSQIRTVRKKSVTMVKNKNNIKINNKVIKKMNKTGKKG